MREKIARAIGDALGRQCQSDNLPYIGKLDEVDGTFDLLPVVDAVLDAMREPSAAMVRIGGCRMDAGDDSDVERVWQAMIEAAR